MPKMKWMVQEQGMGLPTVLLSDNHRRTGIGIFYNTE
jgi:hypothetical protein